MLLVEVVEVDVDPDVGVGAGVGMWGEPLGPGVGHGTLICFLNNVDPSGCLDKYTPGDGLKTNSGWARETNCVGNGALSGFHVESCPLILYITCPSISR